MTVVISRNGVRSGTVKTGNSRRTASDSSARGTVLKTRSSPRPSAPTPASSSSRTSSRCASALPRRRVPAVSITHSGASQLDGRSISIECAPATRRRSASPPPDTSSSASSSWASRSPSVKSATAIAPPIIVPRRMEFRPPTDEDADAIVALLIACDIADFGRPDYDHDALLDEWATPGFDRGRDAFLADDAYGLLLGTQGRAWVRPSRRGAGLEDAVAEWLEVRARERVLPHLDRQVPRTETHHREVLERRGYEPVRSYAELRIPDGSVASLPYGDVRPYDPERDAEAVQALMEEAFAQGA